MASQRVSCIRASLAASSLGRRLTISDPQEEEALPKRVSCKGATKSNDAFLLTGAETAAQSAGAFVSRGSLHRLGCRVALPENSGPECLLRFASGVTPLARVFKPLGLIHCLTVTSVDLSMSSCSASRRLEKPVAAQVWTRVWVI